MSTEKIGVYLIFLLMIYGCSDNSDSHKVANFVANSDADASLSGALNAFRPPDVEVVDDDDKDAEMKNKEAELKNCRRYDEEIWSRMRQLLSSELTRREKIENALSLHFYECSYEHSATVNNNQISLKRTYWIKARTTSWEYYNLTIIVNAAVGMHEIDTVSLKKNHNENFVLEVRCPVDGRCVKQEIESVVVYGLKVTEQTTDDVSFVFQNTFSLQLITEDNYEGDAGDSLKQVFEKYKKDHSLQFDLAFDH